MQSLSLLPCLGTPAFFDKNCNDSIHISIRTLKKFSSIQFTGRCTLDTDAVYYSNLLSHQTIKYYIHVYVVKSCNIDLEKYTL